MEEIAPVSDEEAEAEEIAPVFDEEAEAEAEQIAPVFDVFAENIFLSGNGKTEEERKPTKSFEGLPGNFS